MHHINAISRELISFKALENGIFKNTPVRFIDAFSGLSSPKLLKSN